MLISVSLLYAHRPPVPDIVWQYLRTKLHNFSWPIAPPQSASSCNGHADAASGCAARRRGWRSQRAHSGGGVRAQRRAASIEVQAGCVRQVGRVAGGGFVRQLCHGGKTVESVVQARRQSGRAQAAARGDERILWPTQCSQTAQVGSS